jgi:aryl-alcohol dehydrogenase-like predicted oxidoreductase
MGLLPTKEFHPAELAIAALDSGITYFDTAASYSNDSRS